MADKVITITIPDAKVATALQGFLTIYPNTETIQDPAWVAPDPNPNNEEAPQIAKYTNAQWVTEMVRRLIVRDVRRGLQMLANDAAKVAADDEIAI